MAKACQAVTKFKFVCLTHCAATQSETSEFGAEKGLFQGQEKEGKWVVLKIP